MPRIFITGSSTGLGLMTGQLLAAQGCAVVLHARNAARADDARHALPAAEAVVEGDLETIAAMKEVAARVAELGPFDAIIHNAAVGYQEPHRLTADGLPHVFAVNTLSAYLLTALVPMPRRLVYMSSGMHLRAHAHLDDLAWRTRRWNGSTAYAESKLHDAMLAFCIARRFPDVLSNAVEPGWVATRMGGAGAPDDLDKAHRTQAWLAISDDAQARVSGSYFFHMRSREPNPQTLDPALQDRLVSLCEEISGVSLPG